jgi:bifunctional UDP-N-acetylglucosamine pyrophosphorylase/glucosamine-1-phosphate N-acetyltransferase
MGLYCLAVTIKDLTDLMSKTLHIVILAAGEGTRMKSRLPKVLQPLGGRPMLTHLLDTVGALDPERVHVVVGNGADQVMEACRDYDVNWVHQDERRGTGHAVIQAMPGIPDEAVVLVLLGDHPLIPAELLLELTADETRPLALLTMELDDPSGYGRILRDPGGNIIGVMEHHDAAPAQREIQEVNTGIIMADAAKLRAWLDRLDCDNAKKEYYLPGIFPMARAESGEIHGVIALDSRDLQGANDWRQFAELEKRHRQLRACGLMDAGVHIVDPERIDIRGAVKAGFDVSLDINVVVEGDNRLGDGVSIGPGSVLKNCDLAAGTTVHANCVLEGVVTTGACEIGPFARLRPGTVLAAGCRVGNFVETKNAQLGEGSKASHLSYLGDSIIGTNVNVGAGTITCNYDGANKHQTTIEDDVFIGSDTQLVAPVTVGRGATIGAGSTVTRNAPADSLTVSRSRQTTIAGWKRPRKDGGK